MVMQMTEEARARLAREEWEEREFAAGEAERQREHELKMSKLKLSIRPRHEAISRGIVAALKVPVLPFVVMAVLVLTLAGKDTPQPLYDFLSL